MGILCIILLVMRRKNKYAYIRQILIVILLFVINLRIMIPSSDVKVQTNNFDVLFVIDETISMLAEDYNGNNTRYEGVKEDCKYIINELYGARFSVIKFNNTSQIITPYTKDAELTIETINALTPVDELYARGSSLNVSIDDIKSSLESSSKKEDRKRVLFFISDGEITSEEKLSSFSSIKKYVDDGAVLGYGTSSGGKMKITDSLTKTENYIQDRTSYPYKDAISKIDENNLKKISEDIGIDYINMQNSSNIKEKIKKIKKSAKTDLSDSDKSLYKDTYFIFVIPLCILLIYEYINYKRRIFL